jgi:hypothetical protein
MAAIFDYDAVRRALEKKSVPELIRINEVAYGAAEEGDKALLAKGVAPGTEMGWYYAGEEAFLMTVLRMSSMMIWDRQSRCRLPQEFVPSAIYPGHRLL